MHTHGTSATLTRRTAPAAAPAQLSPNQVTALLAGFSRVFMADEAIRTATGEQVRTEVAALLAQYGLEGLQSAVAGLPELEAVYPEDAAWVAEIRAMVTKYWR